MSPKCVWSEPIFYLENQIKEHFTRSFQLLHSALVAHRRIMLTSSESILDYLGLQSKSMLISPSLIIVIAQQNLPPAIKKRTVFNG